MPTGTSPDSINGRQSGRTGVDREFDESIHLSGEARTVENRHWPPGLQQYRSPVQDASPSTADPSPASTSSITPRQKSYRSRKSLSTTPTPLYLRHTAEEEDHDREWSQAEGWEDEAVLSWDGEVAESAADAEDDGSSVAPGDAGVSEDDTDWGKDALLTWSDYSEADTDSSENDDNEAEGGVHEESMEELAARGMPDYHSWPLKKLQVSHLKIGAQ